MDLKSLFVERPNIVYEWKFMIIRINKKGKTRTIPFKILGETFQVAKINLKNSLRERDMCLSEIIEIVTVKPAYRTDTNEPILKRDFN